MTRSPATRVPPLTKDDALFLDFDGTIVEIAATPDQVRVEGDLPNLLVQAAEKLQGAIAVISGRPLAGLMQLLSPFEGAAAGVHGLERRMASGTMIIPPPDPSIEVVRPMIERFAATMRGIILEDKGQTLALHFRARPDMAHACGQIAQKAATLSDGRLTAMAGKMMVELCPREANKGQAILEFLAEPPFRGRRAVFVGDDRTDEDGFEIVNRLGGISILVGPPMSTSARFRFTGVPEVIAWLSTFVPTPPSSRHHTRASRRERARPPTDM